MRRKYKFTLTYEYKSIMRSGGNWKIRIETKAWFGWNYVDSHWFDTREEALAAIKDMTEKYEYIEEFYLEVVK